MDTPRRYEPTEEKTISAGCRALLVKPSALVTSGEADSMLVLDGGNQIPVRVTFESSGGRRLKV
jgi:hypothetical protein